MLISARPSNRVEAGFYVRSVVLTLSTGSLIFGPERIDFGRLAHPPARAKAIRADSWSNEIGISSHRACALNIAA